MITRKEIDEKINNSEVQTIDVSSIEFNEKIYSRTNGIDWGAVNDYSQNIINMPPIILNQDKKIVDGVHRYKAVLKSDQKQMKIKIIELDEDDIKLANLLIDLKSGVRHPVGDLKSIVIELFDAEDPELNKQLISELDVPDRTFREWTHNIRMEQQKKINKSMASDLLNPFFTFQEIAERHSYKSHSKISDFKEELMSKMANIAKIDIENLEQDNLDFLIPYKNFIEE